MENFNNAHALQFAHSMENFNNAHDLQFAHLRCFLDDTLSYTCAAPDCEWRSSELMLGVEFLGLM